MVTAEEAARNAATGLRIKKRRQELGMSQEDLAARISGGGVSKSTVQKWESGRHFPGRHLGSVEAVLGITLDVEPAPPAAPPPRELPADLQEQMRQVVGDEMAANLIAHYGHMVSGRTPPASGDGPARGSGGTGRRSAG